MQIKVSELFGPTGYWKYTRDVTGGFSSTFIQRYGVTQGEGAYTGVRSTFIRVFGCSLKCPSFGLPHGNKTSEPYQIAESIHLYNSVSELPGAQFGCDSYYAVYPEFKSLSPMLTTEVLARQILDCNGGTFFDKIWSPIHLIFTGGEPMLGWQRTYGELIAALQLLDPVWSKNRQLKLPVTFETNGTSRLTYEKLTNECFITQLHQSCDITWSVSPKLTVSGHTADEAIFPDIVKSYLDTGGRMYFKFVVHDPDDLNEVDQVVTLFSKSGVNVPVYIMAEGGDPSEYEKHSTLELVAESVKRGYNISPRLHVMLGKNVMSW